MASITCSLCNREIEPEELARAWRESAGWVSPHGAKSMTGAQQTGRLAHDTCIVRLRSGFETRQESLV